MISTIRAAQQGPALRSPPHCVKDGASQHRAGKTPPVHLIPPLLPDGVVEAQRGKEMCPESHSRRRLPAWALPSRTLKAVGSITSPLPTPQSPVPHCPSAPSPQPSRPCRHGLWFPRQRPPGSFVMVSRVRGLPRACRDSAVIYSVSLPVYSTPWQKAPGGEFMSKKEGSGEGRDGRPVCVDEKAEERGGRTEFKGKATQSACLCERENDQCWLRSGAGWSRQTLPEPLGCTRCSRGTPGVGSRAWGPQATPRGTGSWRRCTKERPTPSEYQCPLPPMLQQSP